MAFVHGWNPEDHYAAFSQMIGSGRYCNLAPATTPLPKAFSLTNKRTRYLVQGQAGSCHAHSPAQMFSVMAKARGLEEYPACRRLIGWEGEALIGGGNMANGGSPTANIMGMTARDAGVAHESLCPYTDNAQILGQKPPAAVWNDAKKSCLVSPVHVPASFEAIATSIVGLMPVCNGFPCPDTLEKKGVTFISDGSEILGGHSELFIGFADAGVFDDKRWLQMDGWWGLMYAPLPPALAIKVQGYMPINPVQTSDVWIDYDYFMGLCQSQNMKPELVTATDVHGLTNGTVTPAPGTDPVVFVV